MCKQELKRLKRFYERLDILMTENVYEVDEDGNDISKTFEEMGYIVYSSLIEDTDIRL